MDVNIWAALAFMAIGGAIVEMFELHAWHRYQIGKREGGFIPPQSRR